VRLEASVQPETLREVVERAPRLSPFHYFKDRYALLLLDMALGKGVSVRELQRGPFRALFDKPIVRRALAASRGGVLGDVTPHETQKYRLTLGEWGTADGAKWKPSYHQTTRPGMNLVLQLNFTRQHNRAYYALLQPNQGHPFLCEYHPVSKQGLTMSWARIDIEADAGEALIEEIQSDWVRNAIGDAAGLEKHLEDPDRESAGVHPFWLVSYVQAVLEPHAKIWAEATLAAAIVFVRNLGIRRVFYNTFESSLILKDLTPGWCPPRSLYSALPKKFCFQRTCERPRALVRSPHPALKKKLRRAELDWFLLELA
jgi:hypothetical protein